MCQLLFHFCGKNNGQSKLSKTVYFGLWFQRDNNPSCRDSMAAHSQHGSWIRKLREHVFNHNRKAESRKRNEVRLGLCTLNGCLQAAVDSFLQQDQATHPTPAKVLPNIDQVFTHLSPWRTFAFKPLRVVYLPQRWTNNGTLFFKYDSWFILAFLLSVV